MKYKNNSLIFIILLCLSLTGCGGGSSDNSFMDLGSAGANGPGDAAAGFSITALSPAGNMTYLHAFNSFNAPCAATVGQAPTDTNCLLSVREQDLWSNGMNYAINVPPGMCKYLEEVQYSYYNNQAGFGPSSFDVTITTTASGPAVTACSAKNQSGVTYSGAGVGVINGNCVTPDGTLLASGSIKCAYDYSDSSDTSGPNCCGGSYQVNTTTSTTTAGVTTTTGPVATTGIYTGKIGNCLAGPGVTGSWPTVSAGVYKGFPASVISPVKSTGLAKTVTIKPPVTYVLGEEFNLSTANFFNWSAYQSGIAAFNVAPRPRAFASALNTNGLNSRTNEAYDFLCLDEASEVKQRIRLYIVSWDTNEQFAQYANSGGTTGSPVTVGLGGLGCDTDPSTGSARVGLPCHRFAVWDDYKFAPYPFPNHAISK